MTRRARKGVGGTGHGRTGARNATVGGAGARFCPLCTTASPTAVPMAATPTPPQMARLAVRGHATEPGSQLWARPTALTAAPVKMDDATTNQPQEPSVRHELVCGARGAGARGARGATVGDAGFGRAVAGAGGSAAGSGLGAVPASSVSLGAAAAGGAASASTEAAAAAPASAGPSAQALRGASATGTSATNSTARWREVALNCAPRGRAGWRPACPLPPGHARSC